MDHLAIRPSSVPASTGRPHGAEQYHEGDGDPFRAMKRAYGIDETTAARLTAIGCHTEFRDFGADSPARGTFAIVHPASGSEIVMTPYTTPNVPEAVRWMIERAERSLRGWRPGWAALPDVRKELAP